MVKDVRTIWFAGFVISFCLGVALAFTGASIYRQDTLQINVHGEFASEVLVEVTGGIDSPVLDVRDEIVGKGRLIEENSQILYSATSYTYSPGFSPQLLDGTSIYSGTASQHDLGKISSAIIGKNEGSREIVVIPEKNSSGAEILVIDILPTVFTSDMTFSPTSVLPAVSLTDAYIPRIAKPAKAIANATVETLIAGEGEQLPEHAMFYANYIAIDQAGREIENTYTAHAPTLCELDSLMPGLRDGLVDARIGSRLEIGIPAEKAQGNSDVVVVIDLLAMGSQKEDRK